MQYVFRVNIVLLVLSILWPHHAIVKAQGRSEPAATTQTVYLPLLGSSGEPKPLPPQQTTLELIDAALAAGKINLETALLYKAQAIVGDPQLPVQFQGRGVGRDGAQMAREIRVQLPKLSSEWQQRLQPYLLPPSSGQGWYAQHIMRETTTRTTASASLTWKTIDTASQAKIWYHPEIAGQAGRAQRIAAALDSTILPKLTSLFGRNLPPDCGLSCDIGATDGRLDIYMLNRPSSYSGAGGECCDARTGYVVLGTATPFDMIAYLVANVWADAIPVADYSEYNWIKYATSAYAIQHVYPSSNEDPDYPRSNGEHPWAEEYLGHPWQSLEKTGPGGYLFFFYAEHPAFVKAVFDKAMNPDSRAALQTAYNEVFGSPLIESWRNFALYNWNATPWDAYLVEDSMPYGAEVRHNYSITTASKQQFPIAINHLAADYYSFVFGPDVRRITFTNPVANSGQEGGHVWAFVIRNDGSVDVEDWANVTKRVYCRDNPQEDVSNIILFISNGHSQKVLQPGDGTVETELFCGCNPTLASKLSKANRWEGKFTFTYSESATGSYQNTPQTVSVANSGEVVVQYSKTHPDTAPTSWEDLSISGNGNINSSYLEHVNPNLTGTIVGSAPIKNSGTGYSDSNAFFNIKPSTCTYNFLVIATMPAESTEFDETHPTTVRFSLGADDLVLEGSGVALTGEMDVPIITTQIDISTGYRAYGHLNRLEEIIGKGKLKKAHITWTLTPLDLPPGQ